METKTLNPNVPAIANAYREFAALAPVRRNARVDVVRARRIAREFDKAEAVRPGSAHYSALKRSYRALADAIRAQYAALVRHGFRFEFGAGNPYANSDAMVQDCETRGAMRVFDSGPEWSHAFLTREENNMFRAVHDAFGHALYRFQFGPRGEENAFRVHRDSLPAMAHAALACETRFQNSWVNFGPFAHRAPADRPFAEQKVVRLGTYAYAC